MISEKRGAAHIITDEDGNKKERHVHDHSESSNAVLTVIAQQLVVVQHTHQRTGNAAHQLRGTIGTGLQHGARLHASAPKTQQTSVREEEVDNRNHACNHLANARSNGSTGYAPTETGHKHRIQRNVGNTAGYAQPESKVGFLGRDKQGLKRPLQNAAGQKSQHDAPVRQGIGQQIRSTAKQEADFRQPYHAHGSSYCTQARS